MYLLLLCATSTLSAQNTEEFLEATLVAIMPNASLQTVTIRGTKEAVKEVIEVVKENTMNIAPTSLKKKMLFSKKYSVNTLSSVAESKAFRFLANELCETCSSRTVLSKKQTSVIVTKAPMGYLNVLAIYWDPYVGWIIETNIFSGTLEEKGEITFFDSPNRENVLLF